MTKPSVRRAVAAGVDPCKRLTRGDMRVLSERLQPGTDLGNKASGLCRLIANGFAVPAAFIVGPDEPIDPADVWAAVQTWIAGAIGSSGEAALAVRSSSCAEDGATESGAGRFASVVGVFGARELTQAIATVRDSGYLEPLPVIVQAAVDPLFAGVAFSCDPVSFDRDPYVVSWTRGHGGGLVAGRQNGSLIVARSATSYDGVWPHDPATLAGLLSALDALEADACGPVDVEWALDGSGKLWLLQVRPVVLPRRQCIDARSMAGLESLPGVVAGHGKLRLRLAACRAGVAMSNAAVVTARDRGPTALPEWIPSRLAAGLSIVLLHPGLHDNKVWREYAQVNGMDVPFFALGCRRYAIRRFPAPEAAADVVSEVLARGLDQSWVASVVVQEVYDAAATGIVRQLGQDYVAELAVGHFVPKGVADASRFIVSRSGRVLERRLVDQDVAYHFINGHVVTEQPPEKQLQLSDDEIVSALGQVVPLFGYYPDAALEFGISRDRHGHVHAYVIDFAEGDSGESAAQLTRDLIRDGVLSPGRAVGEAVRVKNDGSAELDRHLLEEIADVGGRAESQVFLADRASVDLLPLIAKCGRGSAFVFRHASLLAHLCVVLRERGIPAIVLPDEDMFGKLTPGSELTVEAADPAWIGPRVSLRATALLSSRAVRSRPATARPAIAGSHPVAAHGTSVYRHPSPTLGLADDVPHAGSGDDKAVVAAGAPARGRPRVRQQTG